MPMNMPTLSIALFVGKPSAGKMKLRSNRLAKTTTKGEFIMSAHPFSVSNPPRGIVARTYSSRKEMSITIEKAMNFAFVNLWDWCLVGSYPIVGKGSKAKAKAYKSAWNYQARLETQIASSLAYSIGTYPVEFNRIYNAKTKAYEVRVKVTYLCETDYIILTDLSTPVVVAMDDEHFERTGESIETEDVITKHQDPQYRTVKRVSTHPSMRATNPAIKTVSGPLALQQAMDEIMFGTQRTL